MDPSKSLGVGQTSHVVPTTGPENQEAVSDKPVGSTNTHSVTTEDDVSPTSNHGDHLPGKPIEARSSSRLESSSMSDDYELIPSFEELMQNPFAALFGGNQETLLEHYMTAQLATKQREKSESNQDPLPKEPAPTKNDSEKVTPQKNETVFVQETGPVYVSTPATASATMERSENLEKFLGGETVTTHERMDGELVSTSVESKNNLYDVESKNESNLEETVGPVHNNAKATAEKKLARSSDLTVAFETTAEVISGEGEPLEYVTSSKMVTFGDSGEIVPEKQNLQKGISSAFGSIAAGLRLTKNKVATLFKALATIFERRAKVSSSSDVPDSDSLEKAASLSLAALHDPALMISELTSMGEVEQAKQVRDIFSIDSQEKLNTRAKLFIDRKPEYSALKGLNLSQKLLVAKAAIAYSGVCDFDLDVVVDGFSFIPVVEPVFREDGGDLMTGEAIAKTQSLLELDRSTFEKAMAEAGADIAPYLGVDVIEVASALEASGKAERAAELKAACSIDKDNLDDVAAFYADPDKNYEALKNVTGSDRERLVKLAMSHIGVCKVSMSSTVMATDPVAGDNAVLTSAKADELVAFLQQPEEEMIDTLMDEHPDIDSHVAVAAFYEVFGQLGYQHKWDITPLADAMLVYCGLADYKGDSVTGGATYHYGGYDGSDKLKKLVNDFVTNKPTNKLFDSKGFNTLVKELAKEPKTAGIADWWKEQKTQLLKIPEEPVPSEPAKVGLTDKVASPEVAAKVANTHMQVMEMLKQANTSDSLGIWEDELNQLGNHIMVKVGLAEYQGDPEQADIVYRGEIDTGRANLEKMKQDFLEAKGSVDFDGLTSWLDDGTGKSAHSEWWDGYKGFNWQENE